MAIEEGRVVLEGTPSDIARHPRTDYIAQPVGLNLYKSQAEGHTVHPDAGPAITATEFLSGPVFPPSAVTLFCDPPPGSSARNPPTSPRSPQPNSTCTRPPGSARQPR